MKEQLDRMELQVAKIEEVRQDNNMLHATVVELQQSMMGLRYDVKKLQVATVARFTNRKITWPIPQVSQKSRGKELILFSPPFYTAVDGYKMCLCVYLDGNGLGHKTHISIFFVIMKGDYDALLNWPFNYKVSITLVNQDKQEESFTRSFQSTNTEHFQRPQSSMNVGSGFPKFTYLSVLHDNKYVKDDTMFIKAEVERCALVVTV